MGGLIPRSLAPANMKGGRQAADPCDGQVAQLVEQRTENPRVGSSILPLATIFIESDQALINEAPNRPLFQPFVCVNFAGLN